jgi:membrane protein
MKAIRDWFSFVWSLTKVAGRQFSEDKATRLAAAMAYYGVLSLPALGALVIGVLGAVFGRQALRSEVASATSEVLSRPGSQAVQSILANTMAKASANTLAIIISSFVLLITVTGFFTQLQGALNTVWGVAPKPGKGFSASLRDRLPAFAMVGVSTAVLASSLIVSAGINAYSKHIPVLGHNAAAMQWLNFLFYLALATVIFALVYKYLPDVAIRWREVWLGALVTAFLFAVGQFALSLYFGLTHVASTYGAAGGLILIMLWIYYSTVIFLFGAEVTEVHAAKRGVAVRPARGAVWVRTERGQQQPRKRKAA